MQRLLVAALVAATFALFQVYLLNGYTDVIIIARLGVWDIGFVHHAISWLLGMAPLLWMPLAFHRPSDALAWLLLLFVHLPVQLFAPHVIDPAGDDILPFQLLSAASFYALTVVGRLPVLHLSGPKVSISGLYLAVVLAATVVVVWSLYVFGFAPVNVFEVYERREWAQHVNVSGTWLLSYLFFWAGNVFVVFLIAYGHYRWRVSSVVVGLGLSFCLYAAIPHKGILLNFAAAYLVMFALVYKAGEARMSALKMIGTIFAAFAACFVADLLTMGDSGDYLWTRVIAGRNTLNTGVLSGIYFHFFSSHPPDYYSDSVVGWLLDVLFGLKSDYGLPTARLIGFNFVSGAGSNANVQYLADAFANLGYPGMAIVGLLITPALFYFFDCISDGRPVFLTIPLFLVQGLVIANTSIQSAFLSTGLLGVIALVWCLPTEKALRGEHTEAGESQPGWRGDALLPSGR